MNEIGIDEIVQLYDSFTEIVRQLSLSPEDQIQKLKGTVVPDEIASDFSVIGMPYAEKLFRGGWITVEQFRFAKNIEKKLEDMTKKQELWNNNALSTAKEWADCRKLAMKLLQTLET